MAKDGRPTAKDQLGPSAQPGVAEQFQNTHDTSVRTLFYLNWMVSIFSLLIVAYIDQAVLHKWDLFNSNDFISNYLQDPSRVWALIHAAVLSPWLHFASLPIAQYHTQQQDHPSKSMYFRIPAALNAVVAFWGMWLLDRKEANFFIDILWKVVHAGLALTNVATIFFAFMLRLEAQTSQKELQEKQKRQ